MYDLAIIGAGPGGLAAGLYAGRARLKTVILECDAVGGQIMTTANIENYPGGIVDAKESGPSLMERMHKQAESFNCEIKKAKVVDVDLTSNPKKLTLDNGETIEAVGVIIATGANPNKLKVPGEKEFTGKGVSYCATCDADFFEGFEIFVVGGGNTAVEEATYLSDFARKVNIVVRRDVLRADQIVKERAEAKENIEFLYKTSITEIKGEGLLQSVILRDNETGETREYHCDEDDGLMGVFVFVGIHPNTELFEGKLELTEDGYIPTSPKMETNIPLVYAVGDVRDTVLRQVITAASDGAIAAYNIDKDIKALRK